MNPQYHPLGAPMNPTNRQLTIAFALLAAVGIRPTGFAGNAEPASTNAPGKQSRSLEKQQSEPAKPSGDDHRRIVKTAVAAVKVDPRKAVRVVRDALKTLDAQQRAPERRIWLADLAKIAAPHDVDLRDGLLKRAILDGRRALKEASLWKAKPLPKGVVPFQDPQQALDQERQRLAFSIELWSIIWEKREDRESAVVWLDGLLKRAKAKGYWGSCVQRTYERTLLDDLAQFDPELMISAGSKRMKPKYLGHVCGWIAYSRHLNGFRDRISKKLMTYAARHTTLTTGQIAIVLYYDRKVYLDVVTKLQQQGDSGRFATTIEEFARTDPKAALMVAEREKDIRKRWGLVNYVALGWAKLPPKQLERATKNLDQALQTKWARQWAAEELTRRAKATKSGSKP
jgi:hypothetical protein